MHGSTNSTSSHSNILVDGGFDMSQAISSKMALSRKGSGQKERASQEILFLVKTLGVILGVPLVIMYLLHLTFGLEETRGGWLCQSRDGLIASRTSHGKGALRNYYLDGDRVSYSQYRECTWTQVPHQLDLPKGGPKP